MAGWAKFLGRKPFGERHETRHARARWNRERVRREERHYARESGARLVGALEANRRAVFTADHRAKGRASCTREQRPPTAPWIGTVPNPGASVQRHERPISGGEG